MEAKRREEKRRHDGGPQKMPCWFLTSLASCATCSRTASTEQVKSKKLVTYVSVPDDGEVRETIEFRNISEAWDASLQREREILTVQLGKETRNDDP